MKQDTQSPFSNAPLNQLLFLLPQHLRKSFIENTTTARKQLNADLLNHVCAELQAQSTEQLSTVNQAEPFSSKRFVCQVELDRQTSTNLNNQKDIRYYEQIIFEDNVIPTRLHSWHDFFNGLIWAMFPKTKSLFNALHMDEIRQYGLNPRTKVRNHLTHFDECGVVLFVNNCELASHLRLLFDAQDWDSIFMQLQEEWHKNIVPIIIGHANYEMLLKPFIGLTAKVLIVESLSTDLKKSPDLLSYYDKVLASYLGDNDVFYQNKPFFPLPLLGVPGWHSEVQDLAFYQNKNYFMPKRRR